MAKLLQGGTVLVHEEHDRVQIVKADLLIEGNTITKIETNIRPTSVTEVIDCTHKIITPGFVDTHHHVWQTLLKGRHADHLLIDYFAPGNFTSSLHDPADFYWGQLGGALEMLDVGTTTVVDHAHLNYSPESSMYILNHPEIYSQVIAKAGIAATVASGIRSVFCYSATPRLESWEPFKVNGDLLPDWVIDNLQSLCSNAPFGNGRVELGFAFDGLYLPKDVVAPLFGKVKSFGIKTITTHYVHTTTSHPHSVIETLHSYGLLDQSILVSHATNPSATDAKLLKEANSHVATTPSTELQMGMGECCAFHTTLSSLHSQSSIGVDCHSNNSASIPSELRLLLQSSRSMYHQKFVNAGVAPKEIYKNVEDAFNLGTLGGARAIGHEHDLGTLKVGYKADILIWDALSPSMICAAEHDPVAAVILHSSPSDIDTVIVDGVVRKKGGKLLPVNTKEGEDLWDGEKGRVLEWKEVAKELIKRREVIDEKIKRIDMKKAKNGVTKAFYIDENKFVDRV